MRWITQKMRNISSENTKKKSLQKQKQFEVDNPENEKHLFEKDEKEEFAKKQHYEVDNPENEKHLFGKDEKEEFAKTKTL